jgi:hypothetical protein
MAAELNAVPSETFADSFQNIFKRSNKLIQVGRDYFKYK